MLTITINGKNRKVDVEPDTPLLWVIRDSLDLKGVKFGCGIGQCGACKVLINGRATPSCIVQVGSVVNDQITTIEGIIKHDGELHPVQKAWIDLNVPQCGYCQPGQIIAAISLLNSNNNPSEEDIENAMMGNICRCGTYDRIKKAIQLASNKLRK